MANISVSVLKDADLTVFEAHNSYTIEDIMQALDEQFVLNPTNNIIWDFSKATIAHFDVESFAKVAEISKRFQKFRKTPKTAIIVKDKIEGIAAKLYTVTAKDKHVDVEYKIFSAINEAHLWLEE